VTERLAVTYLRGHGFPNAERSVRTGYRVAGRELVDAGDIDGTPGLAWQLKALKPLTAAENAVPGWMTETERQRVAAGADLSVLVVRRDQRPAEQWFAFLPLVDLIALGAGVPLADEHLTVNRLADVAIPARLYLGDLVTLLRSRGYGDPITEPVPPATPGRVS